MMGPFGGFGAMTGFYGVSMMMFGLLFLAALLGLVVWGVSALRPPRDRDTDTTALEILRRRYARGEITDAEFEQAKQRVA
ncbi:MAG: SHOCT domain-containing protein [Chloroflexi bacterium]|nr:SHOCT domain-containing protein [Chloroflexota bacterium]